MGRIAVHRDRITYSNRRMRRARRLYVSMIMETIKRHPSTLEAFAVRMLDSGLYSPTTGLKSTCFGIIRYMYMVDSQAIPTGITPIWFKKMKPSYWNDDWRAYTQYYFPEGLEQVHKIKGTYKSKYGRGQKPKVRLLSND